MAFRGWPSSGALSSLRLLMSSSGLRPIPRDSRRRGGTVANFPRATEAAGIGEYVQLEFRVQLTPISDPKQFQQLIQQRLNGDDRFIVARPPSIPIVGVETLGFGYGVSEAVIRTTGLANNVLYDTIFSNFDSFGGVIPSVTLIDWNYVDNSADTQFSSSGAPLTPIQGGGPTPAAVALGADPLNPTTLTSALTSVGSTATTLLEIALGVVGALALAWIVTEWKRK